MDVARHIFNSQHSTTDLVHLFGKYCCVITNERGFDIRLDTKKTKI